MHLDIHPAHGGEHTAIGVVLHMTLDLEELPKQVLVGLYPKEGLVDDDEARQL